MAKKSATREEVFLLKLYNMALALGDVEAEIDRYVIGQAIGQNDRSVDALVRSLAQANFVKKGEEENSLYITANGIALVTELQKSRRSP